ncbi:serine/threonine protein phosphatase [Paenibacillus sp. N1-5-1-14]|uniref:metallophosphoesterase family protein n=1 Tax=Paenibacillus radicibacter TaxID=2972488 RepID=UPI0021598208|nr:metallophosphoesterase family protein [Paenibacillus radicibacter]MCR8641667.1 serine/threonine protein phosphatase [Paenibacillus radicibacter]
MGRRTLVISDIHGCYEEFKELLESVEYRPIEDELILLGDYCDRGFMSKEVVEYVMTLCLEGDVKCLRGNHDQMLLNALDNINDASFLRNGGITTIESYCGSDWFDPVMRYEFDRYCEGKDYMLANYQTHIDFLRTLPFYYENDAFIFVHAGLNPEYGLNWKNQSERDFIWIRDPFYKYPTKVDKTVVFGHTPTKNFHDSNDVWYGDGIIGVDGGCCFGRQLNCLEIIDAKLQTYAVKRRTN